MLKRLCMLLVVLTSFAAQPVAATDVAFSMARTDKGFLALLRTAIVAAADEMPGVNLKIEMADNDQARQIEQVHAILKSGVDALIILPVNDAVTDPVDQAAAEAGVPLIYLNRTPPQIKFPGKVTIVTSNELVAGRVQMRMLASLVNGKGRAVILRGAEGHPAAKGRTRGVKEVLAVTPGIEVIHEEGANWSRDTAQKIIAGLLAKGEKIDIIAANNDEMAIGAIRAYEAAGVSLDTVVIGGVDGTPAALAEMKAGNLEISMLQNATGQARQVMKDAVKSARGEYVQLYDWVPYELILQSNLQKYATN